MKILAFDTSTKFLSLALLEDDNLVKEYHEEAGIKHSEILIPTLKDLLESAGWATQDIELICVGLGPGSFTGLRIGVATVKALSAALGCKIKGVPTMDAEAENAEDEKGKVALLLDAHKGKVYSAIYEKSSDSLKRVSDYMLITIEALLDSLTEEVLFFGDATSKYKEELTLCKFAKSTESIDWYPRASVIGRLGHARSKEGFDDPDLIDPLYLHEKECNITK